MRFRLLACVLLLVSCSPVPEESVDFEGQPERAENGDAPSVGECAFNRSDGQYLGPIVEVGPLGHRNMADQRAIYVMHPQLGRMDLTYPRNATVGPCP